MPSLSRPSRTTILMVVLWVCYPLLVLIGWAAWSDMMVSDWRLRVQSVLEPLFGAAALVLLPRVLHRPPAAPDWRVDERRERRALPWGLTVIALSLFTMSGFIAGVIALVSLAGRRRLWWIAAALATYLVAGTLNMLWAPNIDDFPLFQTLLISTLMVSVPILYGLYRGSRRDLLRSLRQEADTARRGQVAREEQAKEAERTRIAREMHDTVSHRLALASLHAGALEYREDLTPEQVREAAGVIRKGLQEAADELAGVLKVLRQDGADATPEATVEDLDRLVAELTEAGTPVTLTRRLTVRDAPPAVSTHLYRVVQEALTNAVKHAPGRPIQVDVHGSPQDGVSVQVTNPLAHRPVEAAGSRVGLVGLAERLDLVGGRFEASRQGGRFVVKAWMPWPS